MSNKTKAELEAELSEALEAKVKLEQENAKLNQRIHNIDAQRPGMTAEEEREQESKLADKDEEIARLEEALQNSHEHSRKLREQIEQFMSEDSIAASMGDLDSLGMVPIQSQCGMVPAMAGFPPLKMLTLAIDIDGGGVSVVRFIAGDDVPLTISEGSFDALKVRKLRVGHELVRRSHLR